jgi:hypothetical protein
VKFSHMRCLGRDVSGGYMLRFRFRSALFIDHKNVGRVCPAGSIRNWIAWLEDGKFDNGRRRTFLETRVYWNPSALKYEEAFKNAGFTTVLCEKFAKPKNGADIAIALDVADFIRDRPRIREYVLFTTDTDFVPVLKKLRVNARRTAVLVEESQAQAYGTYRRHADIVIPVCAFSKMRPRTKGRCVASVWLEQRGNCSLGTRVSLKGNRKILWRWQRSTLYA